MNSANFLRPSNPPGADPEVPAMWTRWSLHSWSTGRRADSGGWRPRAKGDWKLSNHFWVDRHPRTLTACVQWSDHPRFLPWIFLYIHQTDLAHFQSEADSVSIWRKSSWTTQPAFLCPSELLGLASNASKPKISSMKPLSSSNPERLAANLFAIS